MIFGDDSHGITALEEYLSTHFHMKDLENLRYFLEIEVGHSLKGLSLSGVLTWSCSPGTAQAQRASRWAEPATPGQIAAARPGPGFHLPGSGP